MNLGIGRLSGELRMERTGMEYLAGEDVLRTLSLV